jgi:hypothetical protein
MRRRRFITLLGGVAAWPVAANGQQAALPVIGFLNSQSPDGFTDRLRGFRQGLKEAGYVEGETVAIVYRWAENQLNRLPELAADLVHRQVTVIVSGGGVPPALAAKGATTTIPIVFVANEDPVRLGLVTSLARPGGNLTGINFFTGELGAKQFGLLRELVPGAVRIGVLVNQQILKPGRRRLRWRRLHAPWGYKSKTSKPAPGAKSLRLLQRSRASDLTRSSSALTPISAPGECKLQTWRRAMRSPHCTTHATFPKPAV